MKDKIYKLYRLSTTEYVVKVNRSYVRLVGGTFVKVATSRLEVQYFNIRTRDIPPDYAVGIENLCTLVKLYREKAWAFLSGTQEEYDKKLREYLLFAQDQLAQISGH